MQNYGVEKHFNVLRNYLDLPTLFKLTGSTEPPLLAGQFNDMTVG